MALQAVYESTQKEDENIKVLKQEPQPAAPEKGIKLGLLRRSSGQKDSCPLASPI